MAIFRSAGAGCTAALAGIGIALATVAIGFLLGSRIEAQIGSPVVSWEFAPFVIAVFLIPVGAVAAVIGVLIGRWWGALPVGLVFGFVLGDFLA